MADAIHNPRLRFTIRYPDKRTQGRQVKVIGWANDRQWLIDTVLHGLPLGTTVENLRQVDRRGRDLPKQPNLVTAPDPESPKVEMVRASSAGAARQTKPKVLRASKAAHQLAVEAGEEVYAGVPPYVPPDGSRELDYDPPDEAGLETPDPTRVGEPVGEFMPAHTAPDPQTGDVVARPAQGEQVVRDVANEGNAPGVRVVGEARPGKTPQATSKG